MKTSVFDIETDGLDPTLIHCLSVNTDGELVNAHLYGKMREILGGSDVLIGHNIIRYDIPAVENLLSIKIKAKLVDTLALSWYLFPKKVKHGLEEWGEEFGVPKPKIDDWENLSLEEYQHRCDEDVKINTKLWNKCWKYLLRLYGSEKEAWKCIDYLMFKMDCAREQEAVKWKLDVPRCERVLKQLEEDKLLRERALIDVMPWVPKYKTKKKPAKMYLKGKVGVLSKSGEAWEEFLLTQKNKTKDEYEYVYAHNVPNPTSIPQLKKWFETLGWTPDEYKYVRDKNTGDVRKIPQLNEQTPGEVGLTESVKLLYEKEPGIEHLDGIFVIQHRIGILKGFLNDVDERGYISAQIQGLTNTLRFKHKVVLNLPGVDKPYGEDIRGVLIAPEGFELCGSDMSSLEDRTKQHYMWDYDPEYVKTMMADDFDPHLDLAVSAGAMTARQVEDYKGGNTKPYKGIRHTYKQGNYACVYGAQGPTVSRSTGLSVRNAEKLVTAYWTRNWSVKAIADACKVKMCTGQKWLYNPVSKLWYSLRHEKDRFSTLNQGTGVYAFDTWLKYVRKNGPPIIGQMHDEWIALMRKGNRDRMRKHVRMAIDKTNAQLKLNRELDCDIQFGGSYAEIH